MNLRQYFTSNSWWGKLIGGFFGFLIAGPVGALFGILVGNFFDRGLVEHFTRPYWHYHVEREEVRTIFFKTTFSVMGHIAKADGRVSEQEIIMAQDLMKDLKLNVAQRKAAINYFNEGKKANFNLKNTILSFKNATSNNPELINLFIDTQYKAAQVDGFTNKKLQAMELIFTYLGLAPLNQQYRFYTDYSDFFGQTGDNSQQQRHHHRQPHRQSLDHAYALLGINSTASKQEVKRAYRRMMSKNHPDKLIAQGLPEKMIKIANDKTQKIAKAYEDICESKGW